MKYFRYSTYVSLALVILYVALKLHGCVHPKSLAPTLKPGEQARVTYNGNTHTITKITPTSTEQFYADNPTIHISPTGTVTVDTHSIGFQFQPFIGVSYGDGPRLNLGLALFHFWRLDVNGQIAITLDDRQAPKGVVPLASLSYNVYRNSHLFVGLDPLNLITNRVPTIHGGLLVHF